ncbi:MAG: NAD(P)-dependent oxidoreductase [Deltaproteobacteria bacterium]|nr:NAD(P)-dependent oxidoreductase [Deltaproteobacteria bacterium]
MIDVRDECASLAGRRMLITGADGMLGRAYREALAEIPGTDVLPLGHGDLDVTDRAAVRALRSRVVDVIIHCAAATNADWCEEHPAECERVIVEGTRHALELADACHARVLFPQSFLIFDGRENPITDRTAPSPLSVYGRAKLKAEELVLQAPAPNLSVRMAGFFGGDEADKNFVGKIVRHFADLAASGVRECEVGDRVWQPTYTADLARNSLILLAHERTGTYAMASHGEATFFETAGVCLNALGLAGHIRLMKASNRQMAAREKARRPERAVIENLRLKSEGLDRQRPWASSLTEYLQRPYFSGLRAAWA